MEQAQVPSNEADRLNALREYLVLDTPAEPSFDAVTSLAATILGAPIALLSLADENRQWFKSKVGLGTRQTARDISFCGHVVASGAPLVVSDALADERFSDNPLVTGPPSIRFYAGVPLRAPSGFTLGTLCVIDREPRTISAESLAVLERLAGLAMEMLELRVHRGPRDCESEKLKASLDTAVETSERLEWLLDSATCSVITTDTNGTIRALNAAAELLLGYAAQELVGKATPIVFHDAAEVSARAEALSAQFGTPIAAGFDVFTTKTRRRLIDESEWTYIRKDGSRVPVHVSVIARWNSAGDVIGYVGVANDITDQKRAEAESARRETKFRTLYEASRDAVMVASQRGFIDCNPAALRLFGCASLEAFCSTHPGALSPPKQPCGTDSMTLANERIATAMEQGSASFSWVHKRLDTGEPFHAHVLLSRMVIDGEPVAQATVRDVTDDRRRAAELAAFKTMMDHAEDAIFWLDPDTLRFTYANQGATRQLGYSQEEFLTMSPRELRPDTAEGELRRALAPLLDGTQSIVRIETEHLARGGRLVPSEIFVQYVSTAGEPPRLFAAVRDISARKRMARVAELLEKAAMPSVPPGDGMNDR